MSRWHSYINSAKQIIEKYSGKEPLSLFLKNYFKQYKKYGGTDRKQIAHVCYCYYRLGRSLANITLEEKIKAGLFLCNKKAAERSAFFDEDWQNFWSESLNKRIDFITEKWSAFSVSDIFYWKEELSESINSIEFAQSHLIQPDLFLRIRPQKKEIVINKLTGNNIAFKEIGNDCIALSNSTKIDSILQPNVEAVIQDYSSQRIAEFITPVNDIFKEQKQKIKVWDCCAASGGKSILAVDILPAFDLTVSDLRPAIINNLQLRFKEAGIQKYQSLIINLSKPIADSGLQNFKFIICDAPCSGSGTWGRTPEQLIFFSNEKIKEYSSLQKNIVSNVITKLAPGGYFLYITCSVFKKENEHVVQFIETNFNLQLIKQELLIGYNKKADSMFAALFKKEK